MRAVDAGHGDGANVSPDHKSYSEGTVMRRLSYKFKEAFPDTYLTRPDAKSVEIIDRVTRARKAGCKSIYSFHSNWPTYGVIVYYSTKRPQDKPMAEKIAAEISKALGIKNRGVAVRKQSDGRDYYGLIRYAAHYDMSAFIIEHGCHSELAVDTEAKLDKIIEAYKTVFGGGETVATALKRGDKGTAVRRLQENLNSLGWKLTVDGSFGPATEKAVKEFQAKYGLVVDGSYGPKSQAKMSELLAPTKEPDYKALYEAAVKENETLKGIINKVKEAVK